MNETYRIVVSIIRGTNAGRALQLMYNGLQVSAESLEGAEEHFEHYLDCAHPILAAANVGVCFGMASILNVTAGSVCRTEVLMGKALVTRPNVGDPGSVVNARRPLETAPVGETV